MRTRRGPSSRRRCGASRQTPRHASMDLAWRPNMLPNPSARCAKRLDMTGKNWALGEYMLTVMPRHPRSSSRCSLKLQGRCRWRLQHAWAALFFGLVHPAFLRSARSDQEARREQLHQAKCPDAMELLVRGLRSGLPISETIERRRAPKFRGRSARNSGPIGDKVKHRAHDGRCAPGNGGPDRHARIPVLRASASQIQRETGGNLAETLSNLANVLRMRAQMKLKIKAMSSESKASAYIIGVVAVHRLRL